MHTNCIAPQINLDFRSLPRSPGLHISAVLEDLGKRIGVVPDEDDKDQNGYFPPRAVNRMAAGRAWEDWFLPQQGCIYHPGEVRKDGLIGTVDGIEWSEDQGQWIVHECKFTWKSSRRGPEQQWYWMHQVRCGCHLWDTTEARLWVYYASGDYRGSGPLPCGWKIQFNQEEVERTWKMVVAHSKTMLAGV